MKDEKHDSDSENKRSDKTDKSAECKKATLARYAKWRAVMSAQVRDYEELDSTE